MNLPYIIGEAGSCHEESIGRAVSLVKVAKQAKCDAVKFQFWSDPVKMRDRRNVAPPTYDTGSIKYSWLEPIHEACKGAEIAFICSVYVPEDVIRVAPHVDGFKIASFEALDTQLINEILRLRGDRPFFISTGMQEGHEKKYPQDAIYLHCVSAYPCPIAEANLGAIEPHEGYSDHTRMIFTGAMAVSAGADYLEVHFRLQDTTNNCPDYVVALAPDELKRYVEWARTAAIMRGDGIKRVQESERENMKYRVVV